MTTKHHPTPEERDERVSIPLPPKEAVEAFLAVDPRLPTDDEDRERDVAP